MNTPALPMVSSGVSANGSGFNTKDYAMNRQQALAQCKAFLAAYLSGKGLDISRPFPCFNPSHEDTRPSMRFDAERNKVHCFSCGCDYDVIDLVAIEYDLAGKALFQKAYELCGVDQTQQNNAVSPIIPYRSQTIDDLSEYFTLCHARLYQTGYLSNRGIGPVTAECFTLGYDPQWKHPKLAQNPKTPSSPRVIIPTGPGSYIARDIRNSLQGKARKYAKMKVGPVRLFNIPALKSTGLPVIIVESEMDALSVIEVGGQAVGLGGTGNVKAFLRCVEQIRPTQPLILSLDNDKAGKKASNELEKGLEILQIPFYRSNVAGSCKDTSEALERDREAFTALVRGIEFLPTHNTSESVQAYRQSTSAAGRLETFFTAIKRQYAVPTGFDALDAFLGGGLHEGLYIMGAVSSLGKTTLALQIADQAAQSGHDVLFCSLEMSRDELIAKSLSRHTMQQALTLGKAAHAATTRHIMAARCPDDETLRQAAAHYAEYAGRVFILEGSGPTGSLQLHEAVRRHFFLTGNKPLLIVDYMQILAPGDQRMTDKQNMDRSVLALKRISRDNGIPVLAISSLNRAGYGEVAKMEGFKESGAIEYSADVLIGLQFSGVGHKDFNLEEAKNKVPRDIELVVLKNRNGPANGKIFLKYYAAYNYFQDVGGK